MVTFVDIDMKATILHTAALLLACLTSLNMQAQTAPKPKSILFLNGIAHIGNGTVIQNSAIATKDGKITLVADATTIRIDSKAFDTIIYIANKHIYPGIICPDNRIGLVEIDAVRATVDFAEVGSFNPNVRALVSYNTDSKVIPTIRANGVLLTQTAPVGGLLSGSSSVMRLDGWNWEDAVYSSDDGIFVNWPRSSFSYGAWYDDEQPLVKNDNKNKDVNAIRDFFKEAKAYAELDKPTPINLRYEAVKGLFKGTQTLFIRADRANQIVEGILFAEEAGIKRIVISGGRQADKVGDFLKQHNVPVIVTRLHSLPDIPESNVDEMYSLPLRLKEKGVLFCLGYEGDMEVMGSRNLPFQAGTAAAYGLSKEDALSSITLNTAKILGIDKTVGSLEVGKDATLFISTGDALDMLGNNVEAAYIDGLPVDLDTHQKASYRKYMKKYGLTE